MYQNIDRENKGRPYLPTSFYGHVLIMIEPVLSNQKQWINEKIALEELGEEQVTIEKRCISLR